MNRTTCDVKPSWPKLPTRGPLQSARPCVSIRSPTSNIFFSALRVFCGFAFALYRQTIESLILKRIVKKITCRASRIGIDIVAERRAWTRAPRARAACTATATATLILLTRHPRPPPHRPPWSTSRLRLAFRRLRTLACTGPPPPSTRAGPQRNIPLCSGHTPITPLHSTPRLAGKHKSRPFRQRNPALVWTPVHSARAFQPVPA